MELPPRILRRMGYRSDQEGILRRYIREKAEWEKHLRRTREFILNSFSGLQGGVAAVLGSGWLLDVPLEELRERFHGILLVDIHHPPQVRKKAGQMKNVELITADLTGGAIRQAWDFVHTRHQQPGEQFIRKLCLHPPLGDAPVSAFISVNLLNQLDILICDYLSEKGGFGDSLLPPIRSRIQQHHVDWITTRPGCLVADTGEINTGRKGQMEERNLLYASLPAGIRKDQWNWSFDSQGTYRKGRKTELLVKALEWR